MDAARLPLQVFLQQAQNWQERIRRTTYAESIAFSVDADTGEVTITAYWTSAAGVKGHYAKKFTKELLFGPKARWGAHPTLQRLPCTYLRDFMKEVLFSRGVR